MPQPHARPNIPVLAGVRVPAEGQAPFYEMLDALGCTYYDETENRVFTDYMR